MALSIVLQGRTVLSEHCTPSEVLVTLVLSFDIRVPVIIATDMKGCLITDRGAEITPLMCNPVRLGSHTRMFYIFEQQPETLKDKKEIQ